MNAQRARQLLQRWLAEDGPDDQSETLRVLLDEWDSEDYMTLNDYQRQAQRTIPKYWTADQGQTHALFGMTGELGELTDLFKKARFQGHSLNMADVQEELADMLWHWFEMCTFCGWQASDVADVLEAKLQKRYPGNGFTPEDSIARVDKA